MTAKTDIIAAKSTTTANAQSTSRKLGTDLLGLMDHMKLKCDELRVIVQQVVALHPNGDPNITNLNNILAELA